ncbi:hypothetical protein DFH29DRAFT_1084048 [Suillus ampliporus]|nr:hypothetical protein DFH29DRAFT_1084048 [Suillus ampliporus]
MVSIHFSEPRAGTIAPGSPDLGAFTTVFRALNHLQPFVPRGGTSTHLHSRLDAPNSTHPDLLSSLPIDSEIIEGSTV